ncbi:phage portal protein [Embleya sp. NPDC056575]|uniref:phage portal protein n=1 Tax=unclassified Embleya TaxID=2699296 RepID=UPI0036CA7342
MALEPEPGSPDWWLLRLSRKLWARRRVLDEYWDWYTGNHPLPNGPAKAAQAYKDFQRNSRTNFLGMVVDASVFRLLAIGVTDADGKPDEAAWRWWQANKLDSKQKQLFRTALAQSIAYMQVGEHPTIPKQPLVTVEHPRDCITESDPATGRVLAGLKVWYDDVQGEACALVSLDDGRMDYRREQAGRRFSISAKTWESGIWTKHDYGRPAIVPFECRPELGEDPQPEFWAGLPAQNRINLGVLNRMTAARYSAFRQRYVTGHKFATRTIMVPDTDPETGLPIMRAKKIPDGEPFVPDPASTWASEGENTRFGEFSQTDLQGYLSSHDVDIRDLLVQTNTPTYSVVNELVNIATETIVALDGQHLAKVAEHQTHFGEQLEEVLGLCAVVAGEKRDFTSHEIRWKDPRSLNPAVLADMGTKLSAIGYPLGILAENMGESPQRIKRIEAGAAGETMLRAGAEQAARQPAPPQQLQLPDFSLDGA